MILADGGDVFGNLCAVWESWIDVDGVISDLAAPLRPNLHRISSLISSPRGREIRSPAESEICGDDNWKVGFMFHIKKGHSTPDDEKPE